MQLLALLVLAASAATSNGLAAPVANPGATTSQGGLFAAVDAKNAEMLLSDGREGMGSLLLFRIYVNLKLENAVCGCSDDEKRFIPGDDAAGTMSPSRTGQSQ